MFRGTGVFENFGIIVLSSVLACSVFSSSRLLVLVNEIASVSLIDLILNVEVTGEFGPCLHHSAFCILVFKMLYYNSFLFTADNALQ